MVVSALLVLLGVAALAYYLIKSGHNIHEAVYEVLSFEILATYEHIHDPTLVTPVVSDISETRTTDHKRSPFIQGIFFTGEDTLVESEGLNGQSTLREFQLSTGNTLRYVNINKHFFGEGAAIIIEPATKKKIICQLTYKEKMMLLYDYETFHLYNKLSFPYDGYGLASNYDTAYDGTDVQESGFLSKQRLWATVGDHYIYEINIPENLKTAHAITIKNKAKITCAGFKISQVNELEYNFASNSLYGNIFSTNFILEFNYETGNCLKLIDVSGLKKEIEATQGYVDDRENVLNGIALHSRNKDPKLPIIYVTGKRWPKIFKIRFKPGSGEYVARVLQKSGFSVILPDKK